MHTLPPRLTKLEVGAITNYRAHITKFLVGAASRLASGDGKPDWEKLGFRLRTVVSTFIDSLRQFEIPFSVADIYPWAGYF